MQFFDEKLILYLILNTGVFTMKNKIIILFWLLLPLFWYGCQTDNPTQPMEQNNEQENLMKIPGDPWTVYVKYPYTTSATVYDNLSRYGGQSTGWASILVSANGISAGNYYLK